MKPAVKILGKVSISAEGAWDRNKEYERLCLVYREVDNHSFLSKKCVPKGTDLSNTEYWQKVGVVGYKNNDIVVINDIDSSTGEVVRHTLASAINVISPIDRTPGLIVSFYGVVDDSYNNLDWHLYQFKSNDVSEWQDLTNWENINYSAVKVEVTDALTSTDPKAALSANMGRVLSNMISSIVGFSTSIVTTLPTKGKSGVVYFVKNNSSTETRNVYTEYVWLESLGVYEELGEFTTAVDLSGYQPKLVSGANIKTVFGTSILGSGNITMPVASDTAYGGVKLGYTATGSNVPVLKDVNGKLYVTVPKSDLSKQDIIDLLGYTPAKQSDLNTLSTNVTNLSTNVTKIGNRVTTLENTINNMDLPSINPINALSKTTTPGASGVYKTTSTSAITISKTPSQLGYTVNKPFGKVIVPHGTVVNFTGGNTNMMMGYEELRNKAATGIDIYHIVYDVNSDSIFIELVVYGTASDVITYGEWKITPYPSDQGSASYPITLTTSMKISLTGVRDVFTNGTKTGTETTSSITNKDEYRVVYSSGIDDYISVVKASDGKIVVSYKDTSNPSSNINFSVELHNDTKGIHETWYIRSA